MYNVKLVIIKSVCSAEMNLSAYSSVSEKEHSRLSASIERALAEVGVNNFTSNASSLQLVVSLGQKDRSLFSRSQVIPSNFLELNSSQTRWSSAMNSVNLWIAT